MHDLDLIMLTNTANEEMYKMTSEAVNSLRLTDGLEDVNIILIESNKNSQYKFDVNQYLIPDIDFNYNVFLNMGYKYCNGRYTCISNNDIIFSKTWWTKMKNAFEKYNLDAASPKSTMPVQPHNNQSDYLKHYYTPDSLVKIEIKTYSFAGWCLTLTAETRDWLFPLDEQFIHYHQDLDIMMRFNEKNIKHGFVAGSKMHHYGNKSSALLSEGQKKNLVNSRKLFDKKWDGYDMSFMNL
jgi:GT2 family glycosyltransferase